MFVPTPWARGWGNSVTNLFWSCCLIRAVCKRWEMCTMSVNVNFLHGAVNTVNSSGGGRQTAGVHCVSYRLYRSLESSFNPSLRWQISTALLLCDATAACLLIYLFSGCLDIVWVKKCCLSLPWDLPAQLLLQASVPNGLCRRMLPLSGWLIKQDSQYMMRFSSRLRLPTDKVYFNLFSLKIHCWG